MREMQPATAFSYLGMGTDRMIHMTGALASSHFSQVRRRAISRGKSSTKLALMSRKQMSTSTHSAELSRQASIRSSSMINMHRSFDAAVDDQQHEHDIADAGEIESDPIISACANERYIVTAAGGRMIAFDRQDESSTVSADPIVTTAVELRWSAARPGPSADEMAHTARLAGKCVVVRKLPSLEIRATLPCDGRCDGVRYSDDGSMLVAWGAFGARVYDASTLELVQHFAEKEKGSVYGACLSPDGTRVAYAGKRDNVDGVHVRRIGDQMSEAIATFSVDGMRINWLCFDPSGQRLAYSFMCRKDHDSPALFHLKIFDTHSQELFLQYPTAASHHKHFDVEAVGFSPNGQWLLCRGTDEGTMAGQIVVLDVEEGQPFAVLSDCDLEFETFFGAQFLEHKSAVKYTVGWMRNGSGEEDPPVIYVAAGHQLYVVDLLRSRYVFQDGVLEVSQLRGAAADTGECKSW